MAIADQTKSNLPHPNVKDSRVLTYLNRVDELVYTNTPEEDTLVQLWNEKYVRAKDEYEKSRVNSQNVEIWRNAYLGKFNELDKCGNTTEKQMKALRKMAFEFVEQKVNPHIPMPKMSPRYHSDIVPVQATEALLRHEMDAMLSEEVHDESEHATLIDSTCWFKVSWDPFSNTHERSGMPIVECCTIDTVFPQPGIYDYKKLEYIFERKTVTLSTVLELYHRNVVTTDTNDLVNIVECYFLNEDRHVGKFVFTEDTLIVLCNDLEWAMRRRRECSACHYVVPKAAVCPICGSTDMKFVGVKEYKLKNDLVKIKNPYRSGNSADLNDDQTSIDNNETILAGTVIPHYLIGQLPYVPKRSIKLPKDMYGISEVQLQLEPQDAVNKFLNKALRKSAMSKAYVSKLKDTNINDEDAEITYVETESYQEANAIQVKQVVADINEELTMASLIYENAKSTAGITNTDQGKNDSSARSGKAKQIQLAASESRQKSSNIQRNVAYAGVYELIFKNLLAYCDEERSFVSLMPDGSKKEEVWSKYMFLDQDENGDFYYRDDFAWSVDDATEITQDRASMWQLIDNDMLNGTMGNEIDPMRALKMYWTMKDQAGYPTAKYALAFLDEAIKHLPTQIEQTLVNNPEAVELALSYIADMQSGKGLGGNNAQGTGQQGGARNGAGKTGNNQTHAQQQEKANNETRAAQGQTTNTTSQATGGMQGGTGNGSN